MPVISKCPALRIKIGLRSDLVPVISIWPAPCRSDMIHLDFFQIGSDSSRAKLSFRYDYPALSFRNDYHPRSEMRSHFRSGMTHLDSALIPFRFYLGQTLVLIWADSPCHFEMTITPVLIWPLRSRFEMIRFVLALIPLRFSFVKTLVLIWRPFPFDMTEGLLTLFSSQNDTHFSVIYEPIILSFFHLTASSENARNRTIIFCREKHIKRIIIRQKSSQNFIISNWKTISKVFSIESY